MIGPDASFLVALYLPGDKFTPLARAIAAEFKETIAYLPLTELEVTNVSRFRWLTMLLALLILGLSTGRFAHGGFLPLALQGSLGR